LFDLYKKEASKMHKEDLEKKAFHLLQRLLLF